MQASQDKKRIQDLPARSQIKLYDGGFKPNESLNKEKIRQVWGGYALFSDDFHTPLSYAIWYGDFDLMIDLVEAGSDLSYRGGPGYLPPLMFAAELGRVEMVSYLAQWVDPNETIEEWGKTVSALTKATKTRNASPCSLIGLFNVAQKIYGSGDIDATCDVLEQYRPPERT